MCNSNRASVVVDASKLQGPRPQLGGLIHIDSSQLIAIFMLSEVSESDAEAGPTPGTYLV